MSTAYGFQNNGPFTQKVITITYTDLQTAALTNTLPVFNVPTKGLVTYAYAVVTVAFAGTGIATILATLGSVANPAEYIASASLASTGSIPGVAITQPVPESLVAATPLSLSVVSTGANLSALSAGSVDIYLTYSTPG